LTAPRLATRDLALILAIVANVFGTHRRAWLRRA
jgi:hypothetical protein